MHAMYFGELRNYLGLEQVLTIQWAYNKYMGTDLMIAKMQD